MKDFLKPGLVLIALAIVIGAFTACDDKEILKRMEKHSKSLKSLRADITMDAFNSQLGEHDIYKGKLIYLPLKENDAAVRLDWTKPKQESLAIINKQFLIYIPSIKRAYLGKTDKSEFSPMINEALAFMNISEEHLKANYDIKYLGEEKIPNAVLTRHLEFTPKTAKDYKTVEFWVDNNGTPIKIKVV